MKNLLAIIFTFVFSFVVFGLDSGQQSHITRIADPDIKREGIGKITFPTGTKLADAPFPNMVSYEGGWKAGLAEGHGVIRFADTANLHNPRFMGKPVSKLNYYIGNFSGGRPTGEGKLFDTDSFGYQASVSGWFSNEKVVMSINDREIAVMTAIGNGAQKRLVRLMQYPNVDTPLPSRIFFGEATGDTMTGQWVDVPWYASFQDNTVATYGRYLEASAKDGTTFSCTFDAERVDPPNLRENLLGSNGRHVQFGSSLDPLYRSKATCTKKDNEGWSFTGTVDFGPATPVATYLSCKTPTGGNGRYIGDTCHSTQNRKRGFLTNIAKEFKRFIDRRVLGTIDRIGGSTERAMCRATGTEPGVNCNVSVAVGATWPVGDDPANNIPAQEEAVRQRFIAASRRASKIPVSYGQTPLGEAVGMTAELNAVCNALCTTETQQRYSATLLAELERVATLPVDESSIRSIASINRETASVLSAGLRILAVGGVLAGPTMAFYRFVQSAKQQNLIWSAIESVSASPGQQNFADLQRRNKALEGLHALHFAHLSKMTSEGTNLLGESITARIRILRGFPPQRATAISAAIALNRTRRQIDEFIERYKDVKSEDELYNAIISEIVTPLGIEWPPPNSGR